MRRAPGAAFGRAPCLDVRASSAPDPSHGSEGASQSELQNTFENGLQNAFENGLQNAFENGLENGLQNTFGNGLQNTFGNGLQNRSESDFKRDSDSVLNPALPPGMYTNASPGANPTPPPHGFLHALLAKLHNRFVTNCHPADFASVMGTGVSANILYNFPFPRPWLLTLGIVVGILSTTLFAFLLATHMLAVTRDPSLFTRMHRDPTYAPFMGAFVMGYTSLVMFLHAVMGKRHIMASWVLFWIVSAGSVYTAFITLFFLCIAKCRNAKNYLELSQITLAFLLPVVTLTVASSCGQLVAPDLPCTHMQVTTMVVSLIMWSVAMCLAFIIVTINFWRFVVYKAPHSGQVLTMFFPIGYTGQGAYGILLFGRNCMALIMEHALDFPLSPYASGLGPALGLAASASTPAMLSTSIFVVCLMFAVALMSFGYFLTVLAVLSAMSKMPPFCRKPNDQFTYTTASSSRWKRPFVGLLRFHRGFWSMTFPLATMSLANAELYRTFNGMKAFRFIAVIYAGIVFLVVLGCLVGIVYRLALMVRSSARPPVPEPKGEC